VQPYWWIVIAVVVVALIVAATFLFVERRRTGRLRKRFGPEYDRTVEAAGGTGVAQRELAERERRRRRFDLRPLRPAERERYAASWRDIQAQFVDAPVQAVADADRLVVLVMTERGYPMQEFEERAADVSVDHPEEVQDYRAAHHIATESAQGRSSTEDLRTAMRRYRTLFDSLLRDGQAGDAHAHDAPPGRAKRET
jgi:hypothetical protein